MLTAGADTNVLRAIKPPVVIPTGWAWLLWLLAIAALGFVAWWLWRRWQAKRQLAAMIPPVPPHELARKRLAEALRFIDDPREFCIRVSDIARWYLEQRFDFHAPERTTEEFLVELQGTNLLTASQKVSLGDFLNRCDLVKFARYEPREPELRELHAAALRLVSETEPPPLAPDQPPQPVTETAASPASQ